MNKLIHKFAEKYLDSKIIANWRFENYQQALQTKELFDHLRISTVLDVGANEGQYASFLRKEVGYEGTIVSFEPAQEPFEILKLRSASDPDWHCICTALGQEKVTKTFNVMLGSQYNSLLTPIDYKDFAHKNTVIESYDIEVETLNDIWSKLLNSFDLSATFLKMDTQGFDLEVLRGGNKVLKNILGLQSEMAIIPLYEQMPDYSMVIQYLEENDFAISSMHPVIIDKKKKLIEFDGIFVNSLLPVWQQT